MLDVGVKNMKYVIAFMTVLLVAGCDENPRGPGVTTGGGRLESMKPRVFIATAAMTALLREDPNAEADLQVLAERSFKIADAMIDEAVRVDEDPSSE